LTKITSHHALQEDFLSILFSGGPMDDFSAAAKLLRHARHVTAFTGAGISVESGIPSFRGENGLWQRYDPKCLDIHSFLHRPEVAWPLIKEIFYDYFGRAEPNPAHRLLAHWEAEGRLRTVITQNIDNLHHDAGSRKVWEFHGNSRNLVCLKCREHFPVTSIDLSMLPPVCGNCGGLLKPDFVFFGEPIPEPACTEAFAEAEKADLFLVIGTTGEVMPACMIPSLAKNNGAAVIEINPEPSQFTRRITDIFLQSGAGEAMTRLDRELHRSE
jgi:NAD-dependent deacetylase